jgi:hypothetical protein
MALEGTLRDFSFADILQLISLQRKTGVLTLKNEENVVTISFLEGCIVGSSTLSQHTEDRLGLILLKKGHVSESVLDAALRRQEETLQRLGRILIDHQMVVADRVREALEQQILQIVYRVFRWSDGEYHFSQETDIDYDRDLMVPMAADSIIMEGARMTDEWPFVDQRIPDRNVVFLRVDPGRKIDVVEEEDDDFDDLGFNFTESPEEEPAPETAQDKVTKAQKLIYDCVDGESSVNELILESPLIEFETCKALADLIDRSLIREATQEEVVQQLSRSMEPVETRGPSLAAFPWLAFPFLVLLGFSFTIMSHNPINASFSLKTELWNRDVLESVSWYRMNRLSQAAETYYFLHGLYPEDVEKLVAESQVPDSFAADPWGRPYRIGTTTGHKLVLTGSDSTGQTVPLLILSRSLAWEGESAASEYLGKPGVILLDD